MKKPKSTGEWGKATAAKRYNLGGPATLGSGSDGPQIPSSLPPQNAMGMMGQPGMMMKRGGAARKGK